ncbi:MAG: biotin synthase BioB [Candidatus Omnitrophica bacterium]|nr:biotin synthase BioB [Candidatus Omnitrophota bacterium]
MNRSFYIDLARQSMAGEELSDGLCGRILGDETLEILPLLDAAYEVRKTFRGKEVVVHIINNAQNGHCPEDCHYCAQAKTSKADIEEYGLKSDAEMLEEARQAYSKGAYRYCMVFAGRGASPARVERLTRLITSIKSEFPHKEICVSTGFVTPEAAVSLKQAGLDRLNHNLNTSESYYPNICTTHTFADRLNTLLAARQAGIELCSGMIVGMGETHADIIEVAKRLRLLKAASIPVNLLVPIEGNLLSEPKNLTPQFALRVLCLFRFLNPKAEIRVAAGREGHLRSMEVMALYPANSLFLQGYLNSKGASNRRTLQMIKDAGFEIKSDMSIDDLIKNDKIKNDDFGGDDAKVVLKGLKDLRPAYRQAGPH